MQNLFNKFERKIIDSIIKLDSGKFVVQPINVFLESKISEFSNLQWISEENKIKIYCNRTLDIQNKEDVDFIKSIAKDLYDYVFLMEYLESEKYIKLIKRENFDEHELIKFEQNIPLDSFLEEKLFDLFQKDIKPLRELFILKNHNYMDADSYENKKRDIYYRVLTIITILVSVVGIIVDSCSLSRSNIENPVKVEILENNISKN